MHVARHLRWAEFRHVTRVLQILHMHTHQQNTAPSNVDFDSEFVVTTDAGTGTRDCARVVCVRAVRLFVFPSW